MLRVRSGDQVAFELVFFRYKGKLFDFIQRSLPGDQDSESIVQDIFTRLWINREHLDPAKSLNSLLYTMARNEIFAHLRKMLVRRRYIEELNHSVNEPIHTSEQQFDYEELKRTISQLIKEMPEKRRKIFELSRDEGLTYKEIASKLNISENTVDTQIRKALSFLKENLRKRISLFLIFLPFREKTVL